MNFYELGQVHIKVELDDVTCVASSAALEVTCEAFCTENNLEVNDFKLSVKEECDVLHTQNSIIGCNIKEECDSGIHVKEKEQPSDYSPNKAASKRGRKQPTEYRNSTLLNCPVCDKTFKGGMRRLPCVKKHLRTHHPKQMRKFCLIIAKLEGCSPF